MPPATPASLPGQVQAAKGSPQPTDKRPPVVSNPLENAVYFIRIWAALNAERGQAMLDSFTLATEQVQDVRLQILESPKKVASSDILLSGLLEFLLSGTLAGALLRKVTSAVLGGMVNAAALFRGGLAYSTSDQRTAGVEFFQYCTELWRYHPSKGTMSKVTPTETTEYAGLLDLLLKKSQTVSADLEKNLTAVVKAARVLTKERWSEGPIYSLDTVGVDLLETCQTRARAQRLLIANSAALLEARTRSGEIKPEVAVRHAASADLPEFDDFIAECRLRTEALIWAGLYEISSNGLAGATSRAFGGRLSLPGIDDRLVDYWLQRFDGFLKEYAQDHASNPYAPIRYRPGGAPGEWDALKGAPPHRRANPNLNLNIRISWLVDYFRTLRNDFASATEKALGIGGLTAVAPRPPP